MPAPPPRAAAIAAGILYFGAVLALPRLPFWAVVGIALVCAAAPALLVADARRRGQPVSSRWLAASVWPVAHLTIAATGGFTSPLLPLTAAWTLFAAASLPGSEVALMLALALALLVAGERAPPWPGARLLELALLVTVGLSPVAFRAVRRRLNPTLAAGRTVDPASAIAGSEPGPLRADLLRKLVDSVREGTGAGRAVLWIIDATAGRAGPAIVSGGAAPRAVTLRGDPMQWAAEQAMMIRLERTPGWSDPDAAVTLVPVESDRDPAVLLSLEHPPDRSAPELETLEPYATLLRMGIGMYRREMIAFDDRERYNRLLELLRALPGDLAGGTFAEKLADAARQLVGGTGALVASWERDHGEVLALVGEDGGPIPGTAFEPGPVELALVARGQDAVVRTDLRLLGKRTPLATPAERWASPPRALVVMPLPDVDDVAGVLAVWSSEAPSLDTGSVEALKTILPYAGLQFRQSLQFESVREDAQRDPLTGLHNRRAFQERLKQEILRFDRYARPLSLLLVDLDHFKQVNDQLGHEAGDEVLRRIAGALVDGLRGVDFVARFGGEEFVVLLPETRLNEALDAAERIRGRIEALDVDWKGRTIPVRASIGVSASPTCVERPHELIGSADGALYTSKSSGRNRVTAAPQGLDA
ncbi:MAG: diguanylate cyclase [Longimicrobiales bacterium]